MALYHFSEDPNIAVFHPHIAKTSAVQDEAFVWAIDEWHAPMYFLPRDCPRACFWAGSKTTPEDRERWLHQLEPRFVMAIEARWLERIRSTAVYRYSMSAEAFAALGHDGGHYVSRETVVPASVEPVGDLLSAIVGAGVELRIALKLGPLWKQIHQHSTLAYSGTRLRNAAGYPSEFGVAEAV
jgi:uncharacterized protein DUF6886